MNIHVVRHGETAANRGNRLQGHTDTPLSDSGKQTVIDVANSLTDYNYDAIYSSPLKRALDTSKLFAQELRTDIRIEPDLKEICYGKWEGCPKDDLRGSDEWEQRKQDKYNFTHPGEHAGVEGQSYADIYGRVTDVFDRFTDSDLETILVVTHLGVLRNAKKYFEDCSDAEAVTFTPKTEQVYEVTVEHGSVNPRTLTVD